MSAKIPIYIQIQSYIRNSVSTGRFKLGDRLPSEPELATRFATTRTTVAKALQQLVFEGVVSRRMGSGTFVGTKIEDRVDTNSLGSFEDHMLAAGETMQYKMVAYKPARATPEVAEKLAIAPGADTYRLERLRLVNGRVAAVEIRFMPIAVAKGILEEWLLTYTIQDILQECLGLRIGSIDNIVSASIASSSIAKILGTTSGKALLVREHTIFDPKGRPLLNGKSMYPGDFNIRYVLQRPA